MQMNSMNEMSQLFGEKGAGILIAIVVGALCIPKHGLWIFLFCGFCVMVTGAVIRQLFYPETLGGQKGGNRRRGNRRGSDVAGR